MQAALPPAPQSPTPQHGHHIICCHLHVTAWECCTSSAYLLIAEKCETHASHLHGGDFLAGYCCHGASYFTSGGSCAWQLQLCDCKIRQRQQIWSASSRVATAICLRLPGTASISHPIVVVRPALSCNSCCWLPGLFVGNSNVGFASSVKDKRRDASRFAQQESLVHPAGWLYFASGGAAALLRLAQDACGTSYVASTAFVRTGACRAATAPFRHWATQEPLHQHSDRPQRTRQPIICMYSTVAEHQGQVGSCSGRCC